MASQDFEEYRSYLRLLGTVEIGPELQAKIDLSGIVQQTLLDAHQSPEIAELRDSAARRAWLRRTFANNLTDEIRKFRADKRSVDREVALPLHIEDSALRLDAYLSAILPQPDSRLLAEEQAIEVAKALERLPDAQREAISWKYWHDLPLEKIAELMGRTKVSVAGLLRRGLAQLRSDFDMDSHELDP